MDYFIVGEAHKFQIRSESENVCKPIYLNEFETLAEAEDIYSRLQDCMNCYVASIYAPFQKVNEACGYLAALERGDSLNDFLLSKPNMLSLFDAIVRGNTKKPYQASELYKNVVRCLVKAGISLTRQGLICSFSGETIRVVKAVNFENDVKFEYDMRAEVTDFRRGNASELWHNLLQCLEFINSQNDDYVVEKDAEMTEVLSILGDLAVGNMEDFERSLLEMSLLKSTFFWNWSMKKQFVCKMKQLYDPNLNSIYGHIVSMCERQNHGWIKRVERDRELNKLLEGYKRDIEKKIERKRQKKIDEMNSRGSQEPGESRELKSKKLNLRCTKFIRNSFLHFYVSQKTIWFDTRESVYIRNHEALHRRFEQHIGQYCRWASRIMRARDFPRQEFDEFVEAFI